ncbi:uncharacterized protein N7496_005879 [Penicillium cataractarum]|uniref:Uncharacterized protein n=1 Tax=Penicillium cataractarum TaxID=2100454 RepID=A0A9W9S0G5_9EURO|nr:uncharacterized protein N7496_005879 [Penicillium cataractarum]KAJ5369787.1 hypothetical protein N7496_005879 [Penicillium cataractarum]
MIYPFMCIPTSPAFLGTALLGLGLVRLFAPKQAYRLFGLPLRPSRSPSPFIFANAGRDIALGVAFILLGLQRNFEGVRAVLVGTLIAAQVDAFTVFKYGGEEFGGWSGKWYGHSLGGLILGFIAWKGWGL